MRSVDLFIDVMSVDEKTEERIKRVSRGVRTIYSAAKFGRSVATKANVTAAFVDAGLAVLDAIESYANYRQAIQITQQLQAEGAMLRVELAELGKQLTIFQDESAADRKKQIKETQRRFEEQAEEFRINLKNYQVCKEQIKRVGSALGLLRQNSAPACQHLRKLEKLYYQLVQVQIHATITLIDN